MTIYHSSRPGIWMTELWPVEFEAALDQLRPLAESGLVWADCEALERRHQIGRGSLVVLDWIPESGSPTYEERRTVLAGLPSSTALGTEAYLLSSLVRRSTRWRMIFSALKSWRRSRIGREDGILRIAKPARVIKPGIADKMRQHHVAGMRIVALI